MTWFLILISIAHGGFSLSVFNTEFANRAACMRVASQITSPAICVTQAQLQQAIDTINQNGVATAPLPK